MSTAPDHVLAAFGLAGRDLGDPIEVDWGRGQGLRLGDVVLHRADDPAEASWLAGVLEQLRISTVRVARPIRGSDGRWVVSGWTAQRSVAGRPEPRYSEIVEVAADLHRALADLPEPRFLRGRTGWEARADRIGWGDDDVDSVPELADGVAAQAFRELAVDRKPVDLPFQVVHGDLFGNVLFAGTAPPAVVDIAPFWRPASWAAAVVVVDAVAWGGASLDLVEQWHHLPEWHQMVRRALLFRLAVAVLHPQGSSQSLVQVLSAVEMIRPLLG